MCGTIDYMEKKSLHSLNIIGSKFYSLWALGSNPDMGTRDYGILAVTPDGDRYLQNIVGFKPLQEKLEGEVLLPLTLKEVIASL